MSVNAIEIMAHMMSEATDKGTAQYSGVTCRRYIRRHRQPHQSAHWFGWFINGNRISKGYARSRIATDLSIFGPEG